MSSGNQSTLEIEVITTGLKGNGGAAALLGRLGDAADKAEPKVNKLTASVDKLMNAQRTGTQIAIQYANAVQSSLTGIAGGTGSANSLAAATNELARSMKLLADVIPQLNTRTDQSTRAFVNNTTSMNDAKAAARGLAGSMGALWVTYGSMIPLAAGLAIGSSFKQIVSSGAEVEHALEAIRVRGEETYGNIDKMRDSLLDLGKGIYGPKEVVKAFDTLIMAGQSAEQAMTSINSALNLATVGGTSIEKSATTLVQVATSLGYTAAGFDRVGDVIAKTAAVSMSSVDSLSEAFKSASSVGKLYGASLVDIGTALGALSQLGIQGSAAGTSLKNFYKELASESDKLKGVLKDMKLVPADLKDANGNFLDLVTVVGKLSTGLDNLSPAQQKLAMNFMANERGMKTIVEVLDMFRKKTAEGGTELQAFHDKIADSFGYTAIGAAQMALTVENQFKSVKNTLTSTFVETFKSIEPQMLVFAVKMRNVFSSDDFKKTVEKIALTLADLAVKFAENIDKVALFVEGFLAIKAISFVSEVLMGMASGLTAIATGFGAAATGAKLFQASLGIIGALLLTAGAAWAYYHQMKDNGLDNKQEAALTNLEEYSKGLDKELDRMRKVNAELALGKSLHEANTTATQESAIALAEKNKQEAIAAAQDKVKVARDNLKNGTTNQLFVDDQGNSHGASKKDLQTEVDKAENNLRAVGERSNAIYDGIISRIQAVRGEAKVTEAYQADQLKATQEAARAGAGTGSLTGKPDSGAESALKKENDQYARRLELLTTSLTQAKEFAAEMAASGSDYSKLTEGQKQEIKIQYELDLLNGKQLSSLDQLRKQHLLVELAIAGKLRAQQEANAATKEGLDKAASLQASMENEITQAEKLATTNERKLATYGMTKGAVEALDLAEKQSELQQLRAAGVTGEYVNQLERLVKAKERNATATAGIGALDANEDALKALDKALDPSKAFQFGDAFKSAFGKIGEGVDKATRAIDQFGKKNKDTAKGMKALNDIGDLKTYVHAKRALDLKSKKDEMDMYGDLAGAAKGFFKEKTVAYKAFDAVEKGIRMGSMYLAVLEMQQTIAAEEAKAAAKVAGSQTAIAADNAETGNSIINSFMKAAADTVAGVGKAFAQLGVWGFVGAAAIIAFMASMGVGGGGGASAPSLSETRQKSQGTGSVLGDDTAKSESLSKSLDQLNETADVGLKYSSAMLMSLQSINNGISNMARFVASTPGLRGSAADLKAIGVGSSRGAFGFSSESKELQDSGLLFASGQTVGSMKKDAQVNKYADIHEESSSWWGLSSDESNYTQLGDMGEAFKKQVSLTVADIQHGVGTAADALGKSGAQVEASLDQFGINLDHISLKGLSGDDIQKELEAAFSKLGDDMAKQALGGLEDFTKVGEGYFETVVRVASGTEQAQAALGRVGVSMIKVTDITNKQGDVSTELARQSIQAKEAGTSLGEMFGSMTGSMSDLVDNYKTLLDVRNSLRATGLGADVTRDMIAGAGSMDALQSSLNKYIDMLPATQKAAVQANKMRDQFNRLGVELPKSKDAFVTLIDKLMDGDAASQRLAGSVLQLSDGFDELQSTYDDLLSTAKDDLKSAYEDERSQIEETQKKFQDFGKSLREFNDSLQTGSLSTLTLGQKYAELTTRYQNNLSLARSGDADAIEKFQTIANEFLTASQQYNASGDSYTADWASVANDSAYLATVADSQVSVAQQQLDALDKQVGSLIEINTSVMTVAQAIEKLHIAMAQAGYATPVDGSHANGLSYVPFDGYVAELHKGERVLTASENRTLSMGGSSSDSSLVDEIRALRQEVATLRQEQAQQTGQLIGSNYDAQERAANQVVEGVNDAMSNAARIDSVKPSLN
jgi:TP901 family phage tail tape measure protein